MIVVADASFVVAALVDCGREGEWAESLLAESSLAAPELVLVETGNVLRRLERVGGVSSLEATSAYRNLLQLDIELFSFAPFAGRIWELRGNLTSYDAWYVALAESLDRPLATLDKKINHAAGVKCEVIAPL